MDPLSVTASIAAILQLSAKVLAYLSDVKDASKARSQCQIEISNLFSLLVSLKCRLEEGDAGQPWYIAVRALAVENGPLDQFKQALETLQAKMTDGGRLKGALLWRFSKEEITGLLNRMERLKGHIGIALEMDHFKLSKAIKDDTTFLQTQVPVIQSGVVAIRQQHDSTAHRTLLEWLSTSDYPAQQSDIIKRKENGTGEWFLSAPEVAQWLGEAKSTLFCPGIPGAGKTMIAAIAIDHLLNAVHNSRPGIAYVFCNYKTQEEQDVSHMLLALLKQLALGQPSAMEHVEELHQNHASRGTKPPLYEVKNTLQSVLAHYPYVCIVLDALDECQNATRSQLLAELRDLQTGHDIRLMVTARPIPDIKASFKTALRLEVSARREDVERYIAGQTYRLPACIQRNVALQTTVQEKISDAVDGMFLLARLHVDSLEDKHTSKAVKTSLDKLAKGAAALDDAYKEALQRIQGQLPGHRELAEKVLSWITFAKRPLTIPELCCALAVEPEDSELDPDNVPESEDLVSVCAGLVVIDEESAVIRLVHYTTQEYFERTGSTWSPGGQLYLARTCLSYLCFDAFKSGQCTSHIDYKNKLQEHQFLHYAAKNWGNHARPVQNEVADQAYMFLNGSSLLGAVQVLANGPFTCTTTPLHEIARFGLTTLAKRIISAPGPVMVSVNARDHSGMSPLILAARKGRREMVKFLLKNQADVEVQSEFYGSALQAASSKGHEQVVKILLDNGANVNAQGGFYGNALQVASVEGHKHVVKLLLDNGASIIAQNGYYGNALHAATFCGYEQIVKLLLDNGADVEVQSEFYGHTLQAASCEGHDQVVKMLLDNGANVSAQSGHYGNALQAASFGGYEQIVKVLLDNGANVNAQGGEEFSNALQAASYDGYEQILKMLLDHGADVNAQGGYFGNALQAASLRGFEQIVKVLLDNGANVNAQGGEDYSNALEAAASGGHEQVVKILLDHGAEVNTQSSGCRDKNALEAASFWGHTGVVKLLLDHGADPDSVRPDYRDGLTRVLNTKAMSIREEDSISITTPQ